MYSLDYLDCLAQRPAPEQGESFTSYLTRLGAANGQENARAFLHLLEMDDELLRRSHEYMPERRALGRLLKAAGLGMEQIAATTLRSFGARFGRSPRMGSVVRFLGQTFAGYVRYCPSCLAEQKRPHYLLRWRFLTLPGCARHGCRLLDRCEHCGAVIVPLPTPMRLAECPCCSTELASCRADRLDERGLVEAMIHEPELDFLLGPLVEPGPTPGMLGAWLAQQRVQQGLNRERAARQLGVLENSLGRLERGEKDRAGPDFGAYLAYTHFLGINLIDLFVNAAAGHVEPVEGDAVRGVVRGEVSRTRPLRGSPAAFIKREAVLAGAVQAAIAQLTEAGQRVSQVNISRIVGLERSALRRYPKVRAILRELEAERVRGRAARARASEAELAARVVAVIEALRARGERLSQTALSREVGVSRSTLAYYPQVRAIVRAACEGRGALGPGANGRHAAPPKRQSEGEVLVQVEAAVRSLIRRGKPVTQLGIAAWVHISVSRLRQYPQVRKRLDEVVAERKAALRAARAAREDALLARVLDGIETLRARGQSPNQLNLSEILSVASPALSYYPRVRAVIERLEAERWGAIHERRTTREQQLLGGVREACAALEEMGQPLTQENIATWLGVTPACFRRYADVRAFLDQAKVRASDELSRRRDWHKKSVVSRAMRAVRQVEQRGERVTYRSIAALTGCSASALRTYPDLRAAVTSSPNNPRNMRRAVCSARNKGGERKLDPWTAS